MGAHMKTTIDIADQLLLEAKRAAIQSNTTLRELVERGLRQVLKGERARVAPFKLERASFKGGGLQAQAEGRDWATLRNMAYEGRGA